MWCVSVCAYRSCYFVISLDWGTNGWMDGWNIIVRCTPYMPQIGLISWEKAYVVIIVDEFTRMIRRRRFFILSDHGNGTRQADRCNGQRQSLRKDQARLRKMLVMNQSFVGGHMNT